MDPLFASLAALALVSSGDAELPVASGSRLSEANSPATSSAENGVEHLFGRYNRAMANGNFADALKIASKFQPDNPTGQAMVAGLRAAALIGLKRDAEAKAQIAEADRLDPQTPEPMRMMFFAGLVSNQMDVVADALDRLIARAPDTVREINIESVGYFLRNEPAGDPKRNDDRRIALAQIGYGGDTVDGHYIASGAVDILVRRGDFTAAEGLLRYVQEPEELENMLIGRRYAPLWPSLERMAGPHLENVRKASAASAEALYANAPEDHEQLANLANALRHAGRLEGAIALRRKLPQNEAEMSKADEQMGWAINNVAYALHAAGKIDEADQLFASLNDAPMPKEYWRVSMKINRLEFLVGDGKFEKALPLIEPTAKTEGSPYADQLTRRLRYCALSKLGRTAEAESYLGDMMDHAKDAPSATIDGLLCAGDVDRAEKLALTSLNDPDEKKRLEFERNFLRSLQAHPLTSDDPSVWQTGWRQLRQRPAIAAAFDRLGRDMPGNLLPPEPDGRQ